MRMSIKANYIINEELLKLKDVIAANMQAQGLNASGKTAKSLEVVMGDNGGAFGSIVLRRSGNRP